MKYLITIILTIASFNLPAKPSVLSEDILLEIRKSNPNVDMEILSSAEQGNIDAVIETSQMLFWQNNEKLAYLGAELLTYYAKDHAAAKLYLSSRYIEGLELISSEGKIKKILVDYNKSIEYLTDYLENPIKNNDQLYLLAFSMLGTAYYKNENYKKAGAHFLNNIELVKAEQSGSSAFELANLYRDGNGIQEDKEKAFYWYDFAAKKGLNIAIVERNFLAAELGK